MHEQRAVRMRVLPRAVCREAPMNSHELPGPDLPEPQGDLGRSRSSHHFLPGLSIRHRLPLMIAILLGGVMVVSSWASYRGVRDSAIEVGRERLTHLTE